MTRLTWGDRPYDYGVDRGVFYPKGGVGYAWNGLVSVSETSIDASQLLLYIDGVGHANQLLIGSFSANIEAITYPEEFEPFDGYADLYSAQRRRRFDFSYRVMQEDGHYKIHLVYNVLASPTERNNTSLDDTNDIGLFSWEFLTRPELVKDAKSSAHFVIDTKYVYPHVLGLIQDRLYGTEASTAAMPTVDELLNIFWDNALFRVVDNGDGTATVTGDEDSVFNVVDDLWQLQWPSVVQLNATTYRVSSF
jgi:hypothetical protein